MPERASRQPPDLLAVGRVLRPHGVRGELLVEPYSEVIRSIEIDSEILLGDENRQYRVQAIRAHRSKYLMTVEGCTNRETADRLRGLDVRVRFEATDPLPDGTYYRWQIIGLIAVDEAGAELGRVAEIIETGANDVYIVRDEHDRDILLPAIESVIRKIDLEAGAISIRVPEGLDFTD